MLRTISEGVDIGYKGVPRNHMPPPRVRTDQEDELLSAQYKKEKELGRVIKVGNSHPYGEVVSAILCIANIRNTKETGDRAASEMEADSQPEQSQVRSFVVS